MGVKARLRALFDGSAGDAPAPAGDHEAVLADLRRLLCKVSNEDLREEEIDPTLEIYEAGYVDSITGAELLLQVEQQYGVFIPETELVGSLATLDALARHVAAAKS